MREIKFRAWHKENKQMYEVSSIKFDEKEVGYIYEMQIPEHNVEADEAFFDFDEVELMQYIGLKDKHGKKIYKGDIIEISYKNSSIKQNAKVVFEKGCFFADLGDRFAYHIYEVADNCEVIGNIHENSELLK